MIQNIPFGDNFVVMIANEPTTQLNQILEVAKTDEEHNLYKNYKNIKFNNFLFYNIIMLNGTPTTFYALQQSGWMPKHAARAYTRYYKHKDFRDRKFHLMFAPYIKQMMDYFSYPHWLDKYNISTLFLTRNISDKKDPMRYFLSLGWKKYDYICVINGVPQYVFWKGEDDLSFLKPMHDEKVL